jgi:DNA-binding XRE family transcriptional regulator
MEWKEQGNVFGLDLQRFQTLRDAVGMTQIKLAHPAGITQGRLLAIEAGKGNLAFTLIALCAALDANLALLPRIGGNVRHIVDRHVNRYEVAASKVMSVRDEPFIPDPDAGEK